MLGRRAGGDNLMGNSFSAPLVWRPNRSGRMAHEQGGADLAFQRLDLLAERRLLDAEPFGGAGDVALARDGHEVAEMAQFHEDMKNVSKGHLSYI